MVNRKGGGMNNIVFIDCGNFSEPTPGNECYEVMWSNGTSCRRCPNKSCYRNGWLKAAVTKDNKKLVAETMEIRYGKKHSQIEKGK
jgi:hypothetical protein